MAQTFSTPCIQGLEPTILHPNEMLDGALVNVRRLLPGGVLPQPTVITPWSESSTAVMEMI